MSNYFEHSLYLKENQIKELNKVINEEMTINKNVTDMMQNFIDIFNEKFPKIPFEKINNNMSKKDIIFKYKWKNKTIIFKFICYNSFSVPYYQKMCNDYNIGNAETNEATKIITLKLGYISGTLQTPILPILRHEEKHIFQLLMGRQINNWHMNNFGRTIYAKAIHVLKNKKLFTDNDFIVAYLLYTQSDSKTDAFVNQLYQQLVEANGTEEDKVIKNSSVYTYYLKSRQYINIIENNRSTFESIINQYGLPYDKYIKMINKALDRTIKKIGKVIAKYNKDYPLKGPDEILFNNLIDEIIKGE